MVNKTMSYLRIERALARTIANAGMFDDYAIARGSDAVMREHDMACSLSQSAISRREAGAQSVRLDAVVRASFSKRTIWGEPQRTIDMDRLMEVVEATGDFLSRYPTLGSSASHTPGEQVLSESIVRAFLSRQDAPRLIQTGRRQYWIIDAYVEVSELQTLAIPATSFLAV